MTNYWCKRLSNFTVYWGLDRVRFSLQVVTLYEQRIPAFFPGSKYLDFCEFKRAPKGGNLLLRRDSMMGGASGSFGFNSMIDSHHAPPTDPTIMMLMDSN